MERNCRTKEVSKVEKNQQENEDGEKRKIGKARQFKPFEKANPFHCRNTIKK